VDEMMKAVIGWTCVGVFVATAIITLLALVGLIRLASPVYQKRLFGLLIAEIVIVCVGWFAGALKAPATVADNLKSEGREEGFKEAIEVVRPQMDAVLEKYKAYVVEDTRLTDAKRREMLKPVSALNNIRVNPRVRNLTPVRPN
jgi:hypothetical protein